MLPFYLEKEPAKSFGRIYQETLQPQPKAAAPTWTELQEVLDKAPTSERAALIAKVDALHTAARLNYANGDWCNLLNDIHDVLASSATNAEVNEYLQWRVGHKEWFGFGPEKERDFEYPSNSIAGTSQAEELEQRAQSASEAMRPAWHYLRGALGFHNGERGECEKWFRQVWEQSPKHPRAEAALFLSARCACSRANRDWWEDTDSVTPNDTKDDKEQKLAEARKRANDLFASYLQKYPKGRFVADAHGWLGALALREGNKAEALRHYTLQFENREHPEVAKAALFMCEKVLAGADPKDDALFAEAALHPVAAMGATYLVLNSSSWIPEDYSKMANPPAGSPPQFRSSLARKWRNAVLPKLAEKVVANKNLYQPDAWPARYLAILAQAASAEGNHEEGIKLTEFQTSEKETSDDLLLARAICFQRSGRTKEAIDAYRKLIDLNPASPLQSGVRVKLTLALIDNHQAGLALAELFQANKKSDDSDRYSGRDSVYPPGDDRLDFGDSAVEPDISGAESSQVVQIKDAVLNFAPLSELVTALASPSLSEKDQNDLRAVLAERYLAAENFSEAKKYIEPQEYAGGPARLEQLTKQAAQSGNTERKAQAMMELGNLWAKQRGRLLRQPLDSEERAISLFNSNSEQASLRRRENGRALGLKGVDQELEDRDELRHASRWWMRAARALPRTQLAATARWKALEAMPLIASQSDYAFQRALEENLADASRQLYDRLRSECPGSREATKYAVYWSFPAGAKQSSSEDFIQYAEHSFWGRDAIGQMGYRYFDEGAFGPTRDFVADEGESWYEKEKEWNAIRKQIEVLNDRSAEWDRARLAEEVNHLRVDVAKIYDAPEEARYVAVLDDLALFLQEPNLTQEAMHAYFGLRLAFNGFAGKTRANSENILSGYPDYLAFLQAARGHYESSTANAESNESSPSETDAERYRRIERSMERFLANFPKSRKREAALLARARAVHWLTTPIISPYSPKDEEEGEPRPEKAGEKSPLPSEVVQWREPFNKQRAMKPLDDYDKEFPEGHYSADIRNYRGTAAWLARDWNIALDATLATLSDKTHPDLQPEAALRLANIFGELSVTDSRASLLEAIRKRPEAIRLLQNYLKTTWSEKDHPLRYLGRYLAAQLGFDYSQPKDLAAPAPSSSE